LVFKNIPCRLLGDLVDIACGSSRIYMQCNITFKKVHMKLFLFHDKVEIQTVITGELTKQKGFRLELALIIKS
jgi:hypothetical protein